MKNEIMQRLVGVLNALNNITVSGKVNLANLGGSIAVVEEVAEMLEGSTLSSKAQKKKKSKLMQAI